MAEAMNEGKAMLAEEKGEEIIPVTEEEAAEVIAEAVAEGEAEVSEEATTTEEA